MQIGLPLGISRIRGAGKTYVTTDTQTVVPGQTNYTDAFNNVTATGFLNSYSLFSNIGSVTDGTSNLYDGGSIKVLAQFVDNLDAGRTSVRLHVLTTLRNVVPWTTMFVTGSSLSFSRSTALFQEISPTEIAFLWQNTGRPFTNGASTTVVWS